MMLRSLLSACLLCAGAGAVSAQTYAPIARDQAWLTPVVSIPLGPEPSVDGEIRKGEYYPGAKLQDFVMDGEEEDSGYAAPEQTSVHLSYSPVALHVGFTVFMEAGIAPLITVNEGRDTGFADDAFEIFLIPANQNVVFHVGGTAAGVWWDRKIDAGKVMWEWNPRVRYKAQVDRGNNRWTGEFVIPWEDFGVPAPKEGDAWRANFVTNRRAPAHRLDSWSYWRKWNDQVNDGTLIFGGKRPVSSLLRPISEAMNDRGAAMGVWQHKDDPGPRPIDGRFELYARNKPGGFSFLRDAQVRRGMATGEGATFATLQKDIDDTLAEYALVSRYQKIENYPLVGWTGPWGAPWHVEKAGDFVAVYSYQDITDPKNPLMIAEGVIPFRVRSGVQVKVHPYLLTRQSVVLKTDLRAVPEAKTIKKVRAYVTPSGKTDVLAETTMDCAGDPRPTLEVRVPGLATGAKYEAHVQAVNADGKALSDGFDPFNRPEDPDWWGKRNEYGSKPEVPQPWTPIEWKDGTAKVWGRTVVFAEHALPRQVTNQGKDILAAPIRLELRAVGAVQPWTGVTTKVVQSSPGMLVRETRKEAGSIRATVRTQFEFDGFLLTDLTLTPLEGKAAIEGLDLVIPVKPEYAQFLTNYRNAPGPGPVVTRFVGKTPEHYESPVMLTTWLGNDAGGIEWSAESSRGWYLSKPKKAIEVDRKGDVVEARFHFIDAPMTVTQERTIRFGLIATPTKALPAERLNWRIEAAGWPPPIPGKTKLKGGATAAEKDLQEYRARFKNVDILVCLTWNSYTGYNTWHRYITDPNLGAILKAQEQICREMKIHCLANGGWAIAPYAPEWDPWGKEMCSWPLASGYLNQYNGSYGSPYVEFFVGSWARNAREYGLDGVRFDTVFPWLPSENPWLGETWTTDAPGSEGKVFGTQNLFRQREMAKGLYRVFNGGELTGGIIYHPLAGPPIMAVESFVDIHEIGEGHYMHDKTVKEAYPADHVRVWMTGAPYGFVTQNNLKGNPLTPGNRLGPLMVGGGDPRLSSRPEMISVKTYKAGNVDLPTLQIWDAWSWIDRGTARWCPYWENKSALQSAGQGEHYVSFYLQKGRRMLVVAANYEPAAQNVEVKLNAAELGFGGVAIEAKDAVTGEAVPIQDGRMTLKLDPEFWRMVKIGPAAEIDGAPLDQKHLATP